MLYVYCEGPTEALFVSAVLNPKFLVPQGKWATPITADGLRPFEKVRADLLDLLRNQQARVTTLVDYYGMPPDYPGMPHRPPPPGNKPAVYGEVARLEAALGASISSARFVPHYALHEFETLAFADPAAIDQQRARLGGGSVAPDVNRALEQAGGNPELVNDSPHTSPSHRLEALWPANAYQKTADSVGIVQRIPFPQLRVSCTHFDAWLRQL